LAKKHITIVFLPGDARKVKQLKISKNLFRLLSLLSLIIILSLSWMIYDYQTIKKQTPLLNKLKEENNHQKVQLTAIAQKIDQISAKMIELKKFDNKLRVMVNLEPHDDSSQFLGIGGSDPTVWNPGFTMEDTQKKLVRLMHHSMDNLDQELSVQILEKTELHKFLNKQKSLLASTPSVWPVRGWVSSGFGYRISPFTNEREFHSGIDISARMKTPITAPADGIISMVGKTYGFGTILHINHGQGIKTIYGHLDKVLVKKGQYVKRGENIALLGSSGRSTGPHLHYEVHLKGVPLNPRRYILN